MRNRKKSARSGFTLIELLVVVLIIGILAAIALPQYEKAVEKTNAHKNLALIKALANFAEEYKLANGQYPYRFDQLNTTLPAHTYVASNECYLAVSTDDGASYDFSTNPNLIVQVGKYQVVLNTTSPGGYLYVASARKSERYGCYGFFYSLTYRRFTCAEHTNITGPKNFCADVMGLELSNTSYSWRWYNM